MCIRDSSITIRKQCQIGDTISLKDNAITDTNYTLSAEYAAQSMTSTSVHDLHFFKDASSEYQDCMMPGDKGYLYAEVQQNLF